MQELLDSALFDVQVPDEDEEEEEMYDRRDNDWQLAPILMDQPTFDKRQSGDYTIQDFQVPLRGDAQMADAPDDSDGEENDERRTWRRTPRQPASRLRPPLTRQDAFDLPDEVTYLHFPPLLIINSIQYFPYIHTVASNICLLYCNRVKFLNIM